ncbi:MAG: DUF4260 domain-containing protein [Salinivenus sp.]
MSFAHRFVLRLEGAIVLLAALWGYVQLDASWGLFAVLLLAPDISMVGYAWGPRVGAMAYNAVHTYLFPAALAAVGVGTGRTWALPVALIAVAHIGMDRAFGYGLKAPTGFHDTHLSDPEERQFVDRTPVPANR